METKLKQQDPNEELIQKILKSRGWGKEKYDYVKGCISYNMVTQQQFSDLTGDPIFTVNDRTKLKLNKGTGEYYTYLDACTPFKSLTKKGPIFILLNDKAMKYLGK